MVLLVLAAAVLAGASVPLSRRRRRRELEDLMRPGLPVRRAQPRRGVGHLGEAPVATHHRMGGPSNRD